MVAVSATFTGDNLDKVKSLIPNAKILVGETQPLVNIKKYILRTEKAAKQENLFSVLKRIGDETIIVFINFRHQGEQMVKDLKKMHGIGAVFIHGEQSQHDRMKAFEKMRLMKLNLVISTDLLARGVDLPEVRYVINYDMPLTHAEFLHRIGRSGRFGAEGVAVCFIQETDLAMDYVNEIIKEGIPDYNEWQPSS